MLTLITTPGAANANAYAEVATVTTILEGIPGTSAWLSAGEEPQKAAILYITWSLDNLVRWRGEATSPGQALMFPRHGLFSRLGEIYEWGTSELDWTTIPAFSERATAVGAFSFATTTRIADQDTQSISSISIPGLSVTKGGSGSTGNRKPLLPSNVYEIIRDYAYQVQGYTPARVMRA